MLPCAAWDASSAQHTLRYQDGDRAPLWAGAERVRLAFSAGEQLPPPDAPELLRLAARYWRWADTVDAWRARGPAGVISADFLEPGSDAWVSRAPLCKGGAGRPAPNCAAKRWLELTRLHAGAGALPGRAKPS